MKKLMSILLVSVILCLTLFTFIPCVSAADGDWVMAPYAEYITHNGKRYEFLNVSDLTYFFGSDGGDIKEEYLKFADDKTKAKYYGSYAYIYKGTEDIAVQVEFYDNNRYEESRLYVEESYLQEYKNIAQGVSDDYLIYNYYGTDEFKLSGDIYNSLFESDPVTMYASSIANYDDYYIFACDESSLFEVECGMVLYDYYLDKMYLLKYSDYDSSYFYSDGSFNTDVDKSVAVYALKDENIKNKIVSFVETEPEDDLDWLVADDSDDSEGIGRVLAIVFGSFFFGVLPLAAFGFSVVMLFMVKDKKYIRPYAVITIGSILVLAAFIFVLLILV